MTATEQAYRQGVHALKDMFSFDFVSLAFVHGLNRPLLTWQYAAGNLSSRYRRIVLASGRGIAGMVFQAGRGMVIQSVRTEIPAMELAEFPIVITEKLESLYALPLWREDTVEGILMVAFRQANQITPALLARLLDALRPAFCGFGVRDDAYGDSLEHMRVNTLPEQVPVYELLPYHIMQAREDERKKISRELHDSVAQEIASAQMRLRKAKYQSDPAAVLAIMEETDVHLGTIYHSLRNLSAGLRPTVLEDLGLAAAFRSYFDWVEGTYSTVVRFQESIGAVRYKTEVEMVFYRVGQEAVRNACKHSGCDEISVSLAQAGQCLCLEVSDRGFGFEPVPNTNRRTGVGLSSMAERAELIDAALTVRSTPGVGTTVRLQASRTAQEGDV